MVIVHNCASAERRGVLRLRAHERADQIHLPQSNHKRRSRMREAKETDASARRLLNRAQVAAKFGRGVRTIDHWRRHKMLPPTNATGAPRWDEKVIDAVISGELLSVGMVEKLQRKTGKMKTRIESLLRRVEEGCALSPRQKTEMLNAPNGTVDSNIADAIGYHGDDLRGACDFALKIDAARGELVAQIAEIAAGGRPPEPNERAGFLSKVAMLLGSPSAEICLALDISETASWANARDALARRFDAKTKRRAA